MFQPFLNFKEEYLQRLIELNKKILVTQTYGRYMDQFVKKQQTGILMTSYSDVGLAKMHLKAVMHDRYAAIINLDYEQHKKTLIDMLKPGSKYELFWVVVEDKRKLEKRLNERFSKNIARFIQTNTAWNIARDEHITVNYQITYGELYVTIKRNSQTIRVKFEDIEKT